MAEDYPYGIGQKWADVNLDHAAQQMLEVISNPTSSTQKAKSAKDYITNFHSPLYIGQRYKRRFEQLAKVAHNPPRK